MIEIANDWRGRRDSVKHILFFALKVDLLTVLELVESKGPLKYVRMGNFTSHEIEGGIGVFDSGAEITNLGTATADQSNGCISFLVCEPVTPIELRRFRIIDGSERVCIDQLINPDSVTFTPGGIWNTDVVLNGRIATASESKVSQILMKRFHAAVKRTCSKVRAFYVGPRAFALLESGKRLTSAVQSPLGFDLVPHGTNT